jgi:hypothetical protein
MADASPDYIWILGLPGGEAAEEGEGDDVDRLDFFRRSDARLGRQRVPVGRLHDSLSGFVSAMGDAIQAVPRSLGGFSIDSIELSLEVSATGTVSLLGSGGEVSGTGGITLTLTRVPAQK